MWRLCVVSCCFFFKQKTAYEMRISDWSSDVCSSDLRLGRARIGRRGYALRGGERREGEGDERGEREESFQHGRDIGVEAEAAQPRQIGRASCRERVCQYV